MNIFISLYLPNHNLLIRNNLLTLFQVPKIIQIPIITEQRTYTVYYIQHTHFNTKMRLLHCCLLYPDLTLHMEFFPLVFGH